MHKVIPTESLRNKIVLNHHPSSYPVVMSNMEGCMLVENVHLVFVSILKSSCSNSYW